MSDNQARETDSSTLRPPIEVGIPMRDGIELAADIYLPGDAHLPVPAIVQSTPYDKSSALSAPEALFYQRHGYAFVVHDVRGRGKSEGEWRAFVNDGRDGHDVVEWVAAQPWCTGKVGTTGLSYMGWTQWATAMEKPPHLAAMISTSAAGRWQQEIPYTSGVFQLYFGWWVYWVRRRILELHGAATTDWDEVLRRLPLEAIGEFINPSGSTWRDLMDHDTLDEFWRAVRYDDRYDRIDVPCLHVTGWFDLEDLLGAFHHYEHMMAQSPARSQQQLIVGPWSHVMSRNPKASYAGIEFGQAAALPMNDIHQRWFDHWLKGRDNGVDRDPPVRLFQPGTNIWRETVHWPLSQNEATLYLGLDGERGSLAAAPPDRASTNTYRYDPRDPVPTQMDVRKYPDEDVPLDQTANEARPDVLAYTSEPLADELIISGWPHLEFFGATDGDDTDWHVKITDVQPNGRSLKVCQGCLRASYRESLTDPSPLTPGAVYPFDVELWPIHYAFQPGHRIRVTITSSDFPWFARSMNRFGKIADLAEPRVATNTIHHGAGHPSRLRLPVERGTIPLGNHRPVERKP